MSEFDLAALLQQINDKKVTSREANAQFARYLIDRSREEVRYKKKRHDYI